MGARYLKAMHGTVRKIKSKVTMTTTYLQSSMMCKSSRKHFSKLQLHLRIQIRSFVHHIWILQICSKIGYYGMILINQYLKRIIFIFKVRHLLKHRSQLEVRYCIEDKKKPVWNQHLFRKKSASWLPKYTQQASASVLAHDLLRFLIWTCVVNYMK